MRYEFGLSGNHLSASYKASDFCWQIRLDFLEHLTEYIKDISIYSLFLVSLCHNYTVKELKSLLHLLHPVTRPLHVRQGDLA